MYRGTLILGISSEHSETWGLRPPTGLVQTGLTWELVLFQGLLNIDKAFLLLLETGHNSEVVLILRLS